MSVDDASEAAAPTESATEGPGARLRRAREARELALEQVSEALHLDETLVLALEDDRFDQLGAPVFIRGHLKAYARLVGVPDEEVLDAYRAVAGEPATPDLQKPGISAPATFNPMPWAVGALLLLIGAGLLFYVLQEDPKVETVQRAEPEKPDLSPSIEQPRPAPEPATPPVVDSRPPLPPADPVPVEATAPAPVTATAPDPTASPPEPGADETMTLELFFRDESWTEISDRNRRVLFGLQREGMRRELHGEPPFRVLLGNAEAVDIFLDGEPYQLPPDSIRGDVARVTIDPQPEPGR